MNKQKKILCLFDYNCKTGFGTVSENIKKQVKSNFGDKIKLDICAINYLGEPYTEKDGTDVVSAAKSASKHDDFGRYGFLKILKDFDYDGIFILQDLAIIAPIMGIIKSLNEEKKKAGKKQFKSIFYFPVDCPVRPSLLKDIDVFDKLVTYTEYGKRMMLDARPDLKSLSIVNHGVDSNIFKPLTKAEIQDFRSAYFLDKDFSKFIITNINRNQLRKDIPETLFAFAELKKRNVVAKELVLYLHMNPKDPMGWDLRQIMVQLNLKENEDVMFPHEEIFGSEHLTPQYLNKIYNACDLYFTTTLGEGWGLTLHEAAACRIPIVAPLVTSFIEMTNNGEYIYGYEADVQKCLHTDNVVRYKGSTLKIADKLEEACLDITNDTDRYTDKITKAYKSAISNNWELIGHYFTEIFKNVY